MGLEELGQGELLQLEGILQELECPGARKQDSFSTTSHQQVLLPKIQDQLAKENVFKGPQYIFTEKSQNH
jgi:hypothetical protein